MLRSLRVLGCALVALMLLASSEARADALRKVERSLGSRDDSSGAGRHRSSDSRPSSDSYFGTADTAETADNADTTENDPGSCRFFCLVATGLFRVMASPWSLPRRRDDPLLNRYAPYPFAQGPGLLRVAIEDDAVPAHDVQNVALDVSAESGFLLEGVVPANIALRVHLPQRLELSATMSLLTDIDPRDVERATMASAHVFLRHAQMRRAEFRTGLGARLYVGDIVRAGVDMFYGIDAYFARRGVLRVELHGGALGKAFVGEARATVGMMVRRTELYAGYDHTAFIGAFASRLGGPIAGVRRWF